MSQRLAKQPSDTGPVDPILEASDKARECTETDKEIWDDLTDGQDPLKVTARARLELDKPEGTIWEQLKNPDGSES